MNCFDCAALGGHAAAVAICADCGAAVCPAHAHVTARWLTRTTVINRVVVVEPPARTIRCGVCQAARDAAPAARYAAAGEQGTSPRPVSAEAGQGPGAYRAAGRRAARRAGG